jgi:hypothetical protein
MLVRVLDILDKKKAGEWCGTGGRRRSRCFRASVKILFFDLDLMVLSLCLYCTNPSHMPISFTIVSHFLFALLGFYLNF